MPELDEGSLSIGELRAEMRESRRQREALFEKVDDVALRLSGLAAQVEHLVEEVRALAPAVAQYRAERIGRSYVLWFVGLACTGLGSVAPVAAEAVRAFLKHTPIP